MRQIVGFHIVPPGVLWVRFQGGDMRPATELERGTIMGLPGLEKVAPVGWQDSRCQQPRTGAIQQCRSTERADA